MYGAGAVEIVAALVVAIRPRYGGYLVAAWLAGIVVNLLSYGEWYDIAARDFGLMLGALTLGRLASVYDRRRELGARMVRAAQEVAARTVGEGPTSAGR